MADSNIELCFDRGTLVLRGLDRLDGWQWDSRIGALRTHALVYSEARRQFLKRFGHRFADSVVVPARVHWPKIETVSLRSEQQAALQAWQSAGHRGCVIMPTGTGKTEVALAAMAAARIATLVVAPVRDLMHQWHRRIFRALGYDSGIVGDSIFNIKPITVTTYDSAYARMAEMGDRFGLVIFDEAHHLPGRCYREAAMMCCAPMRLGLTATPERSDGRHVDLDDLIGPIIYRQEINEARGKTLTDFDIVRVPVKLTDQEQAKFDQASRIVQSFFLKKQEEARPPPNRARNRSHTIGRICAAKAGKTPMPARLRPRFISRSRSRIERRRSCGCWRTFSGCTPGSM